MFQCWLPINRVLEDPPGELPVLLCYKLNGEWLAGERGGPVRMLVPEAYGFKSVKWLTHVMLTNNHQSNDTYAEGNNDTHSWMKTFARFADGAGEGEGRGSRSRSPARRKSASAVSRECSTGCILRPRRCRRMIRISPPPIGRTRRFSRCRKSGRAISTRADLSEVQFDPGHAPTAPVADALHDRALDCDCCAMCRRANTICVAALSISPGTRSPCHGLSRSPDGTRFRKCRSSWKVERAAAHRPR